MDLAKSKTIPKRKSRIPEHAKCVFEGIIYDVYHWEQELYDGSFETFEMLKRKDSNQTITVINDKILLLKEEQPGRSEFISVPGGGSDDYEEDPLDAAKRELLEETGFESDNWMLWDIQSFGSKIEWYTYYYIVKNPKKTKEPKFDPGEKIQPYLVSFEKFLEETQKKDFRNKYMQANIARIINDEAELEKFRSLLFD